MSTNVTSPSGNTNTASSGPTNNASPSGKGKSKAANESTDDDDDEGEEEGDEEMGSDEEEDEEEEEEYEEIDPSVIVGRRTRGVKVDYTSKEALAKAGLDGPEKDDESDEDVEMKD